MMLHDGVAPIRTKRHMLTAEEIQLGVWQYSDERARAHNDQK